MSRVNIYIQKENEEAWDKIENKSAWVNDKLAGVSVSGSGAAGTTFSSDSHTPAVAKPEQQPVRVAYDPERKELLGKPIGNLLKTSKKDICKEHGVPKDLCRLMKHK